MAVEKVVQESTMLRRVEVATASPVTAPLGTSIRS